MIYFDNAATTQMSEVAINALVDVSKHYYGNASSIYSYGRKSKLLLNESRKIIADCIGANSNEIYFTSCGTESDNWVLSQVLNKTYDKIIVSNIEHHAVLKAADIINKRGIQTIFLPVYNDGVVDIRKLNELIGDGNCLVSIMFQNNETGVIQPIKKISDIVHSNMRQSLFHTDAVQAVGHTHINVKELNVDFLSASAHKFNGPKGVGFLYAREGVELSPFIIGGGQENHLRAGTENVASIYAMAKALQDNVKDLDKNLAHIKYLESVLLHGLDKAGIPYTINGNLNLKAPGVLNISIMGIDGEGLLNVLDMKNICVSTGSACNAGDKKPSHVLKAMNCSDDLIESAVRISIGRYNTQAEVETLIENIKHYFMAINS